MLHDIRPLDLHVSFSLDPAHLAGRQAVERRLADLRDSFADKSAYAAALQAGNPLIYAVTSVEPSHGEGQLHYGLGVLQPGRVGDEYFLTKGHLHAHRPAAEIYIGLRGEGAMLLEDEQTGESRLVPLQARSIVYVPGGTAHRTVNTGAEPLAYLGIYPANAGHDYGAISHKNFAQVVIARNGQAVAVDRAIYLSSLR